MALIFLLLVSSSLFIGKSADAEKMNTDRVDVYLERVYLDGQVQVDMKPVNSQSTKEVRSHFADWTLVGRGKHKLVLKKKMNDISPILKTDGYFGLSKDNILTIYNGKPEKNKAIHSFYQIDVKELESRLQHKLHKGIPIESKGHYEKVMNHLKKYAVMNEQ